MVGAPCSSKTGAVRRSPVAAALSVALLAASCGPRPPPPPRLLFAGLPVSGDLALALKTGFGGCFNIDAVHVRCRRHGVTLFGEGPYEAAVDLRGGDGESGFDQLTLWHDDDQDKVYRIIIGLARSGWTYCYTGTDMVGDQAVFTRAGHPARVSMDISYWGKRRLRIMPRWNARELDRPCTPDDDLVRFGTDVAQAVAAPRSPRDLPPKRRATKRLESRGVDRPRRFPGERRGPEL